MCGKLLSPYYLGYEEALLHCGFAGRIKNGSCVLRYPKIVDHGINKKDFFFFIEVVQFRS